METVVVAKCVFCEKEKEYTAGQVPAGEVPMCECGGVMVAKEAKIKR